MKSLNFKIKGQSYIRVVNKQIYQEINFQGFSGGDRFTVNIGIKPICGSLGHTMRIGSLIYGQDKWWNYSTESENEVVEIIKNKIILKNYKIETQEWLKNGLDSTDDAIRNTQSKKYKKIFEEYKESFEKSANKTIRNIENLESLLENNEIEVMSEMIKEIESEN